MLVYTNTLGGFLEDVTNNVIDDKVRSQVRSRLKIRVGESEFESWGNSLTRVGTTLMPAGLPTNAGVSIECQLPMSSKRIDFILSGFDTDDAPQVVILELKQWTEVATSDKDALVRTWLGGALRETAHPSYQAWSYAAYLDGFNEAVAQRSITLRPCAYLHNCVTPHTLLDPRYAAYTAQAPLFFKNDAEQLRDYLNRFVHRGDDGRLMYEIDHGRIRPSKSLADSLVGLLRQQREFVLLDDQKVAFETAIAAIRRTTAAPSSPKEVVVIRGGPGTGKSVVAVNLLVKGLAESFNSLYVTKNAAPRAVYEAKLTGVLSKSRFSSLFKGSGAFTDCEPDTFGALIVDEAHRLNEKSGLYGNLGENQIGEIIAASRTSVFFLDEDQRIHINDIGSESEIRSHAAAHDARVVAVDLPSQFRCNGSDGYIAFVDQFLGIRKTANTDIAELDYDFRITSSPTELDEWVRARNRGGTTARLVAGYCWDWRSKKNPRAMDIVFPEYEFARQWNLNEDGGLWILRPDSIEQVGCIHTCQGLECDYIGVIIGPDLRRDPATGDVATYPESRSRNDRSIFGWKSLMRSDPENTRRQLDSIIRNTYRTLMTRGTKGCAIWFAP
jgi:DUF2075 family protein